MLDRCPNRPDYLENMCLNEFVSLFKMSTKSSSNEVHLADNDGEDYDTSKHIN